MVLNLSGNDYDENLEKILNELKHSQSLEELYLEEHAIKKIAAILNVNHKDIINSKKEIEKYLK